MPKSAEKEKEKKQEKKVTEKNDNSKTNVSKANKTEKVNTQKKTTKKEIEKKSNVKENNEKKESDDKKTSKNEENNKLKNTKNNSKKKKSNETTKENINNKKENSEKRNIDSNKKNKKDVNNEDSTKKEKIKKKDVKKKEEEKKENNLDKKTDSKETSNKEHVKSIKFEEIKNIFKKKNKLPKEALQKINKPVFQNILVAIIVLIYMIFLIIGFYNISEDIYKTDLKVFSLCILFFAIILLEKAYKEDNGKMALYGIETIIMAVITLSLIYVYLMYAEKYVGIALIISYAIAIYYVIKSIVIYIRERKKYFVNDMKDIINTEE